ncbi:adenylate kinase 7 isoform X2 [Andrena cerasifolii]|uniref:adenylate kinase 7 isoform X2 n=1 Tax=Andrena cerasifolii TaxID=2819439 RepID=UPI004037FFD5
MPHVLMSYANSLNDTNVSSVKEDPSPSPADETTFKPWRVFINHIDSYHGKALVDLLSERVFVNPRSVTDKGEAEEEEEEEEDERVEEEEFKDRKVDETVGETGAPRRDEAPKKYEVIGTTSDPEYPQPEDVAMIIREARNREALSKELMDCGFVIYDITGDKGQVEEARWALKAIMRELEEAEQKAPKAFERNDEVRYFVLISTLMTWAHTKPLSKEEPDLPFTEEDYRKRKPHPNYKEHIQCEKEVVVVKKKLNLKNKLKTLVISSAATYGDAQGPLHYLFKMAWHNAPFLPILGKGQNKIPLLHVRDLSTLVLDVLQNWPSPRYLVAAEQELITQSTIVKKISRALSNGKTKNMEQEEAFLLPEITQQTYDLMTTNLNIDPEYIVDRIAWHLDMPFGDSIGVIVKEYKAARNLHPVRVIVLGPPASGKTRVASYLAKHYDIHYVHAKSLIADTVQALSIEIENATAEREKPEETGAGDAEDDEEGLDEEEEATNVEVLQELLDEIEQDMQRSKGRLDDAVLNKLFLRKLRSKECQNQGYVMDGYPKTLGQVRELFEGGNLNEEEEEVVDEDAADAKDVGYSIMPELVVSLEAGDEFLKERIIQRPEREIQGTHYTEEHMMRRLKEFRRRNTDDNTPLQFFDEIEIHPLIIDVENDICPDMFATVYQCLERLGLPRNYDEPDGETEGGGGGKAVLTGPAFATLPRQVYLPNVNARPHRSRESTTRRPDRLSRRVLVQGKSGG